MTNRSLNVLLILVSLVAITLCAWQVSHFWHADVAKSDVKSPDGRAGHIRRSKAAHRVVKSAENEGSNNQRETGGNVDGSFGEEMLDVLYAESIEAEIMSNARNSSPLSKITVNVTDMKSLGKQLGELHNIIKNFSPEEQKRIGNAGLWMLVDAAMSSDDPAGFGIRPDMSEQERAEAGRRTQNLIIGAFEEFNGSNYYDMIDTLLERAEGRPPAENSWKAIMRGERPNPE